MGPEYQARAGATRKATTKVTGQDLPAAVPALAYLAMGIADEVKKLFRDQPEVVEALARQDSAEAIQKLVNLAEEIGDCLWYLSQLAADLGLDLGLIAPANLIKLANRYGLEEHPNVVQFRPKTASGSVPDALPDAQKHLPDAEKYLPDASEAPKSAVSVEQVARVIRGIWTGERSDEDLAAVAPAIGGVEPERSGSTGFFLNFRGGERILVSFAEIPDPGSGNGVSIGDGVQHMQLAPARARGRDEPLAGMILAMLDRLQGAETLTIQEAAARLQVSQMEVANACWANGLTLAGLPETLEPSDRSTGFRQARVS